jgi:DNA-directed RNA polymerase subunit E'/Rpb7
VYHSDGDAHYRVTFNVVVFKPSVGETLIGTVTHMDKYVTC